MYSNGYDSPLPFPAHDGIVDSNHVLEDGGFAELSEALAAAQAGPSNFDNIWTPEPALQDLSNSSTAVSSPFSPSTPITRPKLGSRFSREVIRTLKNWLAVHQNRPYPKDDEMTDLQERTGLTKAQLTNWFANARRRGKVQTIRPASPQVRNVSSDAIDIIPRPSTPAIKQASYSKNPMQRWVESPPEHEPAAVHAIARAMASSSRKSSADDDVHGFDYTYNEPWRSPYARSSASSAGTSRSSEFSALHSSGSQSSLKVRRPPRRKRASRRRRIEKDPDADPSMPYQCTFCTEVFKTKYDWQRHEKSLHLPLEQWVCALHGPRAPKAEQAELCCVFCGEAAPHDAHIEAHHYSACQERNLDERTFHRKDHLVQHLRLVHSAKFAEWSMAHWMLPMPNIQSRCGFCGTTMSTWIERTDHLADHFKLGATMADWQGDWGFDDAILNMVESAVPPYFIDYERTTLIPMKASDPPWGSPPNAYELLKVELEFFVQNYFDKHGQLPTNDAMQLEACRIIFAAEATPATEHLNVDAVQSASWLRDLIMSSPELTRQARFGPIRTSSESRHSPLRINGKDHLFEQCPLEAQLQAFITGQQLVDEVLDDAQLTKEACDIVRQMETVSHTPSDIFANWVVKGIWSGTNWLSNFKERAGISDANTGLSINAESFAQQDREWDMLFPPKSILQLPISTNTTASSTQGHIPSQSSSAIPETAPTLHMPVSTYGAHARRSGFLPEDTNFFRCFESDIKRWVAATMSPKNPNCHIPSDEEIQHQARWIMYDGDDSWNQTPADYAEWLWRFKRDVGILKDVGAINPADLSRGGHDLQS
ncbi:Nn.00g106490.m01.CDS01 [Neocucurbitaria sp. VM-36]